MPVACSNSTLTGSSGAVYYVPAGTKACLLAEDFDDSSQTITVRSTNDFRVGDPVVFTATGSATLDSGLTAAAPYRVSSVTGLQVVVTEPDGSAVTLVGDGSDGTGHVEMQFAPSSVICEVREFTVQYTRTQLDVSTLSCGVGANAGGTKWAGTKKFQGGPAEITGTLTLYITDNERALGNRLMESVHLNDQSGARVELFLDLVSDGATPPAPDATHSTYIAGPVNFTDFSTGVNPDDPTQAEVSFSMYDPTHWISQDLT